MKQYTVAITPKGQMGRIIVNNVSKNLALKTVFNIQQYLKTVDQHGQIDRYETEDKYIYTLVEVIWY
jgi:hypothetical protein